MNWRARSSRCGRCGAGFIGWRCPGCGRPSASAGCLLLLLPALFLLTGLGFSVPDPDAPAVNELGGGTTEFVLQSAREAVLIPLGALMVALFLLAGAFVLAAGRGPERTGPPGDGDEPEAPVARPGRRPGKALLLTCLGGLALCVAAMGAIGPVTRFRHAEISGSRMKLSSLLWSWELDLSEVSKAEMKQVTSGRGEHIAYELAVEITDSGGSVHRSVTRRLRMTDSELARWRGVMRAMVDAIKRPPSGPTGRPDASI